MVQDILASQVGAMEDRKTVNRSQEEPPVSNFAFWIIIATFLVMLSLMAAVMFQLESVM